MTGQNTMLLAQHGNRLSKPQLRHTAQLCRDIMQAFTDGQTPVQQVGKSYWSDLALAGGTRVQLGVQLGLKLHAETKDGLISLTVNSLASQFFDMSPIDVVSIAACLQHALDSIEAALVGNGAHQIKQIHRDLALAASREAYQMNLIDDHINILLPTPFHPGTVKMYSNYTSSRTVLPQTKASLDALPRMIQVTADYNGGITIENVTYKVTKRKWTAAAREELRQAA